MAIIPLISLGKYPFETGGLHHMNEKSECARRIRHRKETTGLSVGSNRVDMRKIPGMLRKHSLPRLQTEEGNNHICLAWKPIKPSAKHGEVASHRAATLQIDNWNIHVQYKKQYHYLPQHDQARVT